MKAIKFAASALTVLALAVSSGCQMFHSSDAPIKQGLEPVKPGVNVDIRVDTFTVKLNDSTAKDVNWDRLKKDILAQVPNGQVLPNESSQNGAIPANQAHLSEDITPEIFRKALALQGEVTSGYTNGKTLDGLNLPLRTADEIGFLKLPLCEPNVLAPGVYTSQESIAVTPVIRSTGDILLNYQIDYTPDISVPGCPDYTRKTLPGARQIKRTSTATLLKGQSLALSGFRDQIMDPVTQTYADPAGNILHIVVIKPTSH